MNVTRRPRSRLKIPFWLMCAGIFILALLPEYPRQLPLFALADKLVHGVTFLVLTLIGLRAYPARVLLIVLLLAALGGGIEIAQGYVVGRSQELADFYADLIGIATGVVLSVVISFVTPAKKLSGNTF